MIELTTFWSEDNYSWKKICYNEEDDTFFQERYEVCGVDLSDERCTGVRKLTEEYVMEQLTDEQKERLSAIRRERGVSRAHTGHIG